MKLELSGFTLVASILLDCCRIVKNGFAKTNIYSLKLNEFCDIGDRGFYLNRLIYVCGRILDNSKPRQFNVELCTYGGLKPPCLRVGVDVDTNSISEEYLNYKNVSTVAAANLQNNFCINLYSRFDDLAVGVWDYLNFYKEVTTVPNGNRDTVENLRRIKITENFAISEIYYYN